MTGEAGSTRQPRLRTRVRTILTVEDLKDAVAFYRDQPEVAFDTETMGEYRLDPRRNQAFWLSISAPGRADVIPFGHPIGEQTGWTKEPRVGKDNKTRMFKVPTYSAPPKQLWPADVFDAFAPVFFNPDRRLWGHNVKFDLETVAKYYDGEFPCPPYGDTMIAAFLLNENFHTYRLGDCVKREFGYTYDKSVGKAVETYPYMTAAQYAYLDAKYTWLLARRYYPLLRAQKLDGLFELEMDVLEALCRMEAAGSPRVDIDALRQLDRDLDEQLVEITGALYRIVGRQWNFDSHPQKVQAFYGKRSQGGQALKILKRTDKGAPSCDSEALERHRGNALVDKFLEYQDVHKISSTYVKAYLGTNERKGKDKSRNNAPPYNPETGRIHANFRQTGTVTGRFSCVAADTLIDMPRDLVKQPDGVPITDVCMGDWVYAFDWQRELVLRQVTWVGQTGVKQTVIVTAQDSAGNTRELRLTPEHLVRMWNGDWRPAGTLAHRWGDARRLDNPRLMTMVKRTVEDGYVRIYPHAVARSGGTLGGGRNREHRFVMGQVRGRPVSTKADVHHLDGNGANNSVGNLEVVSVLDHRGSRHLHPGWGQRPMHEEPMLYDGPNDFRVVSVEPGPVEPVWDMTVDDAHSFIANGICVHNCSEPNLQNIPRPDTELGKRIRGLFVAGPDEVLIVADWSQIEYRILAKYSGDKRLVQAFLDGLDFHQYVASLLLGKDFDDVTPKERTVSKNTNFATVYGAGVDKVAAMSGVTLAQAEEFLAEHQRMLRGVYRFRQRVIDTCRSRRPPYVRTMLGRVRRLPQINSSDYGPRRYAERQAVNTVIQGSAADLMKLAIVRQDALCGPNATGTRKIATLNLTVHDELVTTVPSSHVEEGLAVVREAMMGADIACLLDPVPLVADIKVVKRWSEAKG